MVVTEIETMTYAAFTPSVRPDEVEEEASFYRDVFGLLEGDSIEIRSIDPLTERVSDQSWFRDHEAAARHTLAQREVANVFYGTSPRVYGGGKKKDVTRLVCAFV